MIGQRAAIDVKDEQGQTPLLLAIAGNHLEAARALRVPRHHLLRLSREAERFSASPLNLVRLAERGKEPRQHQTC